MKKMKKKIKTIQKRSTLWQARTHTNKHTNERERLHSLARTHARIHVRYQVWAPALDWFFFFCSSLYILLFIHLNSCSHYLLTLTFQLQYKKSKWTNIHFKDSRGNTSPAHESVTVFRECVSIDPFAEKERREEQKKRNVWHAEQEGGGEDKGREKPANNK